MLLRALSALSALSLVILLGQDSAAQAPPAPDPTEAIGRESAWPLTIKTSDATLTVYQPQLDAWDGVTLSGRVAVQASFGEKAPPAYGIVTLSARTLTDKGTRVVTIDR